MRDPPRFGPALLRSLPRSTVGDCNLYPGGLSQAFCLNFVKLDLLCWRERLLKETFERVKKTLLLRWQGFLFYQGRIDSFGH